MAKTNKTQNPPNPTNPKSPPNIMDLVKPLPDVPDDTQKITYGDMHVHTTGSDGKLSPLDVANKEHRLGHRYVTFTDHYPYPPGFFDGSGWNQFHNESYRNQVEAVKRLARGDIEVFSGAEFDWIPFEVDWTRRQIEENPWDYSLGSVHMVFKDKTPYPLNWSEEHLQEALKAFGSARDFYQAYYREVIRMADSKLFDGIAHLDVLKTFNQDGKYFREDEFHYQLEVSGCLDAIAESGACLEINSGGWRYPCNDSFPSYWIVKEAHKRKIPITVGSDGHNPKEVGIGLDRAVNLAKRAGYGSVNLYDQRQRVEVVL